MVQIWQEPVPIPAKPFASMVNGRNLYSHTHIQVQWPALLMNPPPIFWQDLLVRPHILGTATSRLQQMIYRFSEHYAMSVWKIQGCYKIIWSVSKTAQESGAWLQGIISHLITCLFVSAEQIAIFCYFLKWFFHLFWKANLVVQTNLAKLWRPVQTNLDQIWWCLSGQKSPTTNQTFACIIRGLSIWCKELHHTQQQSCGVFYMSIWHLPNSGVGQGLWWQYRGE